MMIDLFLWILAAVVYLVIGRGTYLSLSTITIVGKLGDLKEHKYTMIFAWPLALFFIGYK
jgi:hypothetical protein